MNAQLLDQARAAYRAGDYSAAAQMFAHVKTSAEVFGEVDHLRGNSLMKLGMWKEAAAAYSQALGDQSYGKQGALLTNRGKALVAAGDVAGAIASFSAATQDASYATPYKAYQGLGKALSESGDIAGAGTAFRSAAIDSTNPAPAGALSQLASSFIKLDRPQDAIESYRTALDFVGPRDDPRSINAGLGEAYAAAGRFSDALETFGQATADGIYQLTPDQASALERARDAAGRLASPASTDMAAAGAPGAVDPLDPLGQSGSIMPDPSDTGFFTLSESEMIQQDRQEMRVRRRRHTGRRILITVIVLVVLALAGAGFAYTRGYGFPTQDAALTELFDAVTHGKDAESRLDPALSDAAKATLIAAIPSGSTPTIESMDRSMTQSTARVSVKLSQGGTQTYVVKFARGSNHIGWTVHSVAIDSGSAEDKTPSLSSPASGEAASGQTSPTTDADDDSSGAAA